VRENLRTLDESFDVCQFVTPPEGLNEARTWGTEYSVLWMPFGKANLVETGDD
jgi:hypothetical protein